MWNLNNDKDDRLTIDNVHKIMTKTHLACCQGDLKMKFQLFSQTSLTYRLWPTIISSRTLTYYNSLYISLKSVFAMITFQEKSGKETAFIFCSCDFEHVLYFQLFKKYDLWLKKPTPE